MEMLKIERLITKCFQFLENICFYDDGLVFAEEIDV